VDGGGACASARLTSDWGRGRSPHLADPVGREDPKALWHARPLPVARRRRPSRWRALAGRRAIRTRTADPRGLAAARPRSPGWSACHCRYHRSRPARCSLGLVTGVGVRGCWLPCVRRRIAVRSVERLGRRAGPLRSAVADRWLLGVNWQWIKERQGNMIADAGRHRPGRRLAIGDKLRMPASRERRAATEGLSSVQSYFG
jgi:hypothetical protein